MMVRAVRVMPIVQWQPAVMVVNGTSGETCDDEGESMTATQIVLRRCAGMAN